MSVMNLKSLVAKLNPVCRRSLEGAASLCMLRTNYNVEIEHWLMKLLEVESCDLQGIFKHYDIDKSRLSRELTHSLEKLKTGNGRAPELSLDILDLMRESWVLASLEFGDSLVRSGQLLAALISDRSLGSRIRSAVPELGRLPAEGLEKELTALTKNSIENDMVGATTAASGSPGGSASTGNSKTPALDQFTMNLTERARKGDIDPVIGRDFEIRQVIDILTRRRQNNPILTGEAGVGKTAVVEGFALRVAAGDVPDPLKKIALRTLDLGLLQAGAGVKGEFENRLKSVIAEVKASSQPIILFIDEAHTLIGAGGAAGQGDAANLLKPALARGELRTIAATTWAEYKKFFETDAALKRRFQVVKVEEPETDKAVRMVRGLTSMLEKHHGVRILEEAVTDAVKLSHRYITDRQLPDKAVSLLDTACARVALTQSATPAALEDCRRELEHLQVEDTILQRESILAEGHQQRLDELRERQTSAKSRLDELEKRWAEEKQIVGDLRKLRTLLEEPSGNGKKGEAASPPPSPAEQEKSRQEFAAKEQALHKLQGETPLVFPVVSSQAIAEVVSGWTGIPLGKMVRNEIEAVLTLENKLKERVIGQDHALTALAERIRTARANLVDPRRPIGVFMLVGPSGVGKTESAMALADILYGGDRSLIVINMSEYKEEHKISRLTGSAPGYVGFGEGGVLTEAVRRKPYSVVLLDEVEKANPNVQEIFYQVFDKGTLQDDKGNDVNFKNTIILLTSNVGTDTVMKLCADPETRPDSIGLAEALRPDLLKAFKPALLGRIHVIPYFPLSDDVVGRIIRLQLQRIGERLKENHRATLTYDDTLVQTIANRCKEVESGARNVDHILTGTLLPDISRSILGRVAEGAPFERVHISVDASGNLVHEIQ